MAKKAGTNISRKPGGRTVIRRRRRQQDREPNPLIEEMLPIPPEDANQARAYAIEQIDIHMKALGVMKKKLEAGNMEPTYALSPMGGAPFELAPGKSHLEAEIDLATKRSGIVSQVPGRPGSKILEFRHGTRLKE